MKDILGKELKVGDQIVYGTSGCWRLSIGVVCKVGKNTISVLGEGNTRTGTMNSPERIVKVGRNFSKNYQLTELSQRSIELITDEAVQISDLSMSQVGLPMKSLKFCDTEEEQKLLKAAFLANSWCKEDNKVKFNELVEGCLLEILKDIKQDDSTVAYYFDIICQEPNDSLMNTLKGYPHFVLRIAHT